MEQGGGFSVPVSVGGRNTLAELIELISLPDERNMEFGPDSEWSGLRVTLTKIKASDNGGLIIDCHVLKTEE